MILLGIGEVPIQARQFSDLAFIRNSNPGHGIISLIAEAMMKRSLLCLFFLLTLDGSGFSQPAKSAPAFYVVLNSLTKNCTVVDKVPRTDTPNITVASDAIFKTRAEAETAVKTLKPCNQ
jgi:hypothetical protein